MPLRDDVERVVRAWDAHELERGARPVVDFDTHPPAPGQELIVPASSRLDVHEELTALRVRAVEAGDTHLVDVVTAHLAYLRHLLGERPPIADYIRQTQGCDPAGWSPDYVAAVRERARGDAGRRRHRLGAGHDG